MLEMQKLYKKEENMKLRDSTRRWKEGYCEYCYTKGIMYHSKVSNKWFCSPCLKRGR